MKRHRLPKAMRAELLARQGGLCIVWGCTESRNLIEEHSTPFTWTGELPDQLMCEAHHKEKTRKDIKAISKVKRIRKRAEGKLRPKKTIQSAPFRTDIKKDWKTGKVTKR